MDKREIIKRAFEQGILLSPEALERIDAKSLEDTLKDARQSGRLVVAPQQPRKSQITVKIRKLKPRKTITAQDAIAFYQAKYTVLRDLLSRKVSPVSINKAADIYSDVSVIGMVRSVTTKGVMLEDQTGEIEAVMPEKPGLDDVIGVRGSVREGRLFSQEIVWPDIPLKNGPEHIAGLSVLLSRKPTDTGADLIFTLEPDGNRAIHVNTNPAWVTISKAGKKALLLVYRPPEKATVKDAVEWLKKRCLPHKRDQVMGPDNPLLLKSIPDLLWVVSEEQGQEFYKGVTVVSAGQGAVRVDFGTMKAEFF